MSDRYRVLSDMLDDPKNLAIVLRELARRDHSGQMLVTPPIIKDGTVTIKTPESYVSVHTEFEFFEPLCVITMSPDNTWWAQFNRVDVCAESSIGPFDSKKEALEETRRYLSSMNCLFLDEVPWDEDDLKEYP